ncbi:MAG: sigma-70 family RNA polymerase sigma factor [Chitinophagaceae bacterium]
MSSYQTNDLLAESQELTIKGCIQGDRAAQARLYNSYSRKMMGVCLWYAKNRQEAEEILQDGFIRVFRYIGKFKGTGSLEGWIRSAMVSAALSKYRNKSAHLRPMVEFDPAFHDKGEEPFFAEDYDEKELIKLIQQLSPSYRLVFNLYVFEGMKHREIADALNISEGTSKSNLSAARTILQKAILEKKKIA